MTKEAENKVKEEIEYQSFPEFLETTPPNQVTHISELNHVDRRGSVYLNRPQIQIHCSNEKCNGLRFFRCISDGNFITTKLQYIYLTYRCSNCQETEKIYSLAVKYEKDNKKYGECSKLGELPTYGPPVPSKLVKLIGPDREEFLKGRRCENQGLGVGAFIYYRRVVENQKNRILNEIIKVSEKIGADKDKVITLKSAVKETQFSKALNMAKDAIPESLLINGHSPILLLHSALSEGVHSLNDEECLEIAGSIRIVLGELSERLSQALKDETQLKNALTVLMNKKKG